jgi:benzodiazapine receptor
MSNLNTLNYLNLIGFIINTIVTFGASAAFGFPDNAELSNKYQTIVTPSGGTFAIWGIIFLSQGIFAIVQMLQDFRSNLLVQKGVSIWYFSACMFQSWWTFAFGYERIGLSTLMMGGILISLIPIVWKQSKIEPEPSDNTVKEFWLLKFPFSIHCGWIAAAFAVNVNVLVLSMGSTARTQEAWAYATIVYAVFCALMALVFLSPPDFTIPSVLVWASIGIASELKNPSDSILDTFAEGTIKTVRGCVIALATILAVVTAGYGAYRRVKNSRSNVIETDTYNGERIEKQ